MLLDLDQKTLPGIAHQVVEQMIISDQIRAQDRANVLRALLLKHRSVHIGYVNITLHISKTINSNPLKILAYSGTSYSFGSCSWIFCFFVLLFVSHPSDGKEHSLFKRNISATSLGSLISHYHSNNHIAAPEPPATDPLMAGLRNFESRSSVDLDKNEVLCSLQSVCVFLRVKER